MRLLQPERRFLFVLAVIAAASVAWAEPGDFDSDGDVDLADFLVFQECFRGSGVAISPPCDAFDLDADGDVDLSDFIAFQGVFTRAGPRLRVVPARSVIVASQRVQFTAELIGVNNPSVVWAVEAPAGSGPGIDVGTIDASGLYTPPAAPEALAFLIRAESVARPGLIDRARVLIFGSVGSGVPVSAVLPGPGDSPLGLRTNVTVASPPTSTVLTGLGDTRSLDPNTTVASPPVLVDFGAPP